MSFDSPTSPPRRLVRLWEWGGMTGAALAVVMAVGAWVIVDNGLGTLDTTLTVTSEGLEATSDSLQAVDATLLVVVDAAGRLGESLADVDTTVSDVSTVIGDTSQLLTEDLPGDIEAIRAALDGLIDTAGVVDGVLGALSFVGVPYDPEVPMDDALTEVDERIAALSPRLQTQGEALSEIVTGVDDFGSTASTLAEDLQVLGGHVESSRLLLPEYRASLDEAILSVDAARSDLGAALVWLRISLIVGTLLAILFSSVVWWLGRAYRLSGQVADAPAPQATTH